MVQLLIFLGLLLSFNFANAACSSPLGAAGQVQWDSGASTMEYCDGTNWSDLALSVTGNACSTAGQIQQNSGDLQFCNGTNWVTMNGASLGSSCSGTASGTFDYVSAGSHMRWCDGTNWRRMGQPPPDATVTFLANAGNVSDLTSYTYAGLSLGTEYSNRYIVVGIVGRSGGTPSVSSVTVAGTSATSVYQHVSAGSLAAFYIVALPTGTSGDVVVNFSTAMVRAAVILWSVRHLQSITATNTYSLTGASPSASIDVPAGGIALGAIYNSNSNAITWSGISTSVNGSLADTHPLGHSGAASAFSTAQTGLSVTTSCAGWNHTVGAIISLR